MKSKAPTQEQIGNWLESVGFQSGFQIGDEANTDRIKIFRNEQCILELILVRIGEWLNKESFAQLEGSHHYLTTQRAAGNRCIMLWEDYWMTKPEIVKSRLSAMLGLSYKIPARLTIARRIDKKDAISFLETNHLNGSVSSKFRYGLFLPNRYYRVLQADFQVDRGGEELLVAVATFSHPRIFQQEQKAIRSYELIRFASVLDSNVIGGLDKLLNAFVKDRQPDDIMTYADLEWSDGASYRKLGFEMKGQTPPIAFNLDLNKIARSSKSAETDVREGQVTVYNAGSLKFVKPFEYAH
ncbi:MAG: hypothetical protein ABIN80_25990 [Dyadobacter sp.]|uniref:hypothetical protein n=1 Tax=Dyadobacter sp. TaxID=1914288 RepID=UPI003267CAC8